MRPPLPQRGRVAGGARKIQVGRHGPRPVGAPGPRPCALRARCSPRRRAPTRDVSQLEPLARRGPEQREVTSAGTPVPRPRVIKLILVHARGVRTQSTGQDHFIESAFRSMYKCTELKKISTPNMNSVSAPSKLRVRVSVTDRIQTVDAYCLQTEFHHAS